MRAQLQCPKAQVPCRKGFGKCSSSPLTISNHNHPYCFKRLGTTFTGACGHPQCSRMSREARRFLKDLHVPALPYLPALPMAHWTELEYYHETNIKPQSGTPSSSVAGIRDDRCV